MGCLHAFACCNRQADFDNGKTAGKTVKVKNERASFRRRGRKVKKVKKVKKGTKGSRGKEVVKGSRVSGSSTTRAPSEAKDLESDPSESSPDAAEVDLGDDSANEHVEAPAVEPQA